MAGNPDQPAASPEPWKRRIDLLVLAAVAAWTLGSQALVGPRVWDFAIDNSPTLQAVQGRPVSLDRNDPRDLFVHRAGEVKSRLMAPISRPRPIATIRTLAGNYVHPPFYFLLLQLWVIVFGNAPGSWSIFGALQMAVCAALLYRLARLELDTVSAVFPALFISVSLPFISQSQQVRHYLLTFIMACIAVILAYPAVGARRSCPEGPRFHWAALGVCLALGLNTHYLFIFLAAGINLAAAPAVLRIRGRLLRQWIFAQLLGALLFSPTLVLFFIQLGTEASLHLFDPIENVPLGVFKGYVSFFFYYSGRLTVPIVLVLGLSLAGLVSRRPGPLARLYIAVFIMSIGVSRVSHKTFSNAR